MNFALNERCVWTIQVPNATVYRFNLYGLDISETADGLSITTLRRNQLSSPPTLENRIL
jgi:hypothetical protein